MFSHPAVLVGFRVPPKRRYHVSRTPGDHGFAYASKYLRPVCKAAEMNSSPRLADKCLTFGARIVLSDACTIELYAALFDEPIDIVIC